MINVKKTFRTGLIIVLIAANAILGKAQRNADYPSDLKQLHENIWTDILKGSTDNDNIQKITEKLSDKGAWPDIDYASKQRGNWQVSSSYGSTTVQNPTTKNMPIASFRQLPRQS